MPTMIEATATADSIYGYPFKDILDSDVVNVDISDLTTAEVDADGRIKPGLPLTKAGDTVTAGFVYGCVIEPVKVVAAGPTNATLAANTGTVPVTVGTIGTINRDVVEDNLERPLTAAEIAGFDLAGSKLHLTRT